MKVRACALLLLSGSVSAADAPAGLDRLAMVMPGTWHTQGQTFDSQFTKAGPQNYTTQRDCWRDGSSYKCVFVVNGSLQLYDIFSWDANDKLYHETQVTPQGKQPEFHVSVQGDIWTYDQDIVGHDNAVIHYRITRSYTSATSADYGYAYSTDGKQWTQIAKGTETRVP